jgi:hypothetical protein
MAVHEQRVELGAIAELAGGALRGAFRRVLADLATAFQRRPLPLEGESPDQLRTFVARALEARLFDDLSWLSPESAAGALFELWFALPACDERATLYSLLISRLLDGDLETFVVLARAFVQAGDDTLRSPAVRARVSLALGLPLRGGSAVDSLALSLLSEPSHARRWLEEAARGSLPSRRLAARLIERAAREAGRLAERGDDAGLRVLDEPGVRLAMAWLLADREALVWRHVAVARGLLTRVVPRIDEELTEHLAPEHSPTEWRRAACALSASISVQRDSALARTQALLRGPLMRRDPGLAGCIVWGLLRVAEVDEAVAEELLPALVRAGGIAAVEAFLDLVDEGLPQGFGRSARDEVQRCLRLHADDPRVQADDGAQAFGQWLEGRFKGVEGPVSQALRAAVARFETDGARGAAEQAGVALAAVHKTLSELTHEPMVDAESRRRVVMALCELDRGLLHASTVADLISLYDTPSATAGLARIFEKLVDWLIRHEHAEGPEVATALHPALRMQRVRVLLHAVDADGSHGDGHAVQRRPQRLGVTRVLLGRVRKESGSPLSRALAACLARSFDALVREQGFTLSDVILCAALYVSDAAQVRTLAEASMLPDATQALERLAALVDPARRELRTGLAMRHALEELSALAASLPASQSTRVSALRWALRRLHISLLCLHDAGALSEVLDSETGRAAVASLQEALATLSQLVAGSRRRLNPAAQLRPLTLTDVLRAFFAQLEAREDGLPEDVSSESLAGELSSALAAELPAPIASVVHAVLGHVTQLPRATLPGRRRERRESIPSIAPQKLPHWLPPSRLLGGFFVFHTLGEGGGGSVFAARRAEERHDEQAEVFALKVPEYNGHVAHLLSEPEFLRMFREEAGALLALPDDHPHLARFVTFDAGVRPKPILVMEHVEGPSLEKLILRRHVDVAQATLILQGVASGLHAMHRTGIAHLDLKPGNVIVRGFWSGNTMPVLVDFGLSGRRLRPGCGTPCYSAPEVWGAVACDDPRPSDVYAFACLAYEVLSGQSLFPDGTPSTLLSMHISHDGLPAGLAALAEDPAIAPVVQLLSACLRREPGRRSTMEQVLQSLPSACAALAGRALPLVPAEVPPARGTRAS